MTNVSKYQMGLKLISISMLHLTSNIESSRQLSKETTTILVLTDSTESNSDINTFTQFEEGNIITKTRNDAESGDESNKKQL